MQRFDALALAAKQFSAGINMGFLYDPQRRLFGIGYVVGGPREFTSHYDLLASECRLASLVAIAKGDVPIEHWFALGRPHVSSPSGQTLLSWSGTMFEYLMPLLFMRTFANSLLDRACREAVQRQIDYGREKSVPWGISESAYSALDSNQIYQYRAFGVPALALNPGMDGRSGGGALRHHAGAAGRSRRRHRQSQTAGRAGAGGSDGLVRSHRLHAQSKRGRRVAAW